jgi:hypothetical protein
MNLFGLSPLWFAVGALALAGALFALHLLRVRLRRVEVDTLLFFRLAGALQKPRVLPGRPARWWAFLLALLALLAGWSAIAEPRVGLAAPSRFVVVEPSPVDAPARLARAAELAAALGPRGRVVAASWPPAPLLLADEPLALLTTRGERLRGPASAVGQAAAFAALRDALQGGDELWWLGAEPATAVEPRALHVPVATVPAVTVRELQWRRGRAGAATLVVVATGGGPASQSEGQPAGRLQGELRSAGQVLAQAAGEHRIELDLAAMPAGTTTVELVLSGLAQPLVVPLPDSAPRRIAVAADVPANVRLAVEAVLAVDGELAVAEGEAAADVLVVASERTAEPRPQLVVDVGVGDGQRRPRLLAGSPAACSLRDRERRSASALPARPWSAVWIADDAQHEVLAGATVADGRCRVHVVDWLLEPVTHADVPLLLLAALRELASAPGELLALAGQPLRVPAGLDAGAEAGEVVDGTVAAAFAAPGRQDLALPAGPRQLHVLADVPAPRAVPATAAPVAPTAAVGGTGSLVPWLLLLLFTLLVADAVLFHRGRLP